MSGKQRKVKENRSDWVAVESEFSSSTSGVKLEKAKSSFQFYQKEKMGPIREELQALATEGEAVDLGFVQRELSTRVSICSNNLVYC